jgi:predicted nucleic acid-binding protein
MLNLIHGADLWRGPLPRKHQAADPADSYLLDLMDAAQPDYAVTGDKRSGLLQLEKLGRTKILNATEFLSQVLHL